MIVLIDQVSNLDEHLYLLLGISRLQKSGQVSSRLPIQKPYQSNIKYLYKAGKRMSTNAICPVVGEKSL